MPGVVDGVSAARVRVDRASSNLEALQFQDNGAGRTEPTLGEQWRGLLHDAVRSLQEAIDALNRSLDEE